MGNLGSLFVSAFLKYVESHPELVEKLVESIVTAVIAHLNAPKA